MSHTSLHRNLRENPSFTTELIRITNLGPDKAGPERFSDHGDHPITRDHPIVDATKFPARESQIVQSGQPVVVLAGHNLVRAVGVGLVAAAFSHDSLGISIPSEFGNDCISLDASIGDIALK